MPLIPPSLLLPSQHIRRLKRGSRVICRRFGRSDGALPLRLGVDKNVWRLKLSPERPALNLEELHVGASVILAASRALRLFLHRLFQAGRPRLPFQTVQDVSTVDKPV